MIWHDLMEDESWFIDPFTLMRKSMEICHEAQPLPNAARSLSKEFSRWLVTSWTSKRRGVEHAFQFDWHPNIVQKVTSCTDQDGPTCGIEWCFVTESWHIKEYAFPAYAICRSIIYIAFVTSLWLYIYVICKNCYNAYQPLPHRFTSTNYVYLYNYICTLSVLYTELFTSFSGLQKLHHPSTLSREDLVSRDTICSKHVVVQMTSQR